MKILQVLNKPIYLRTKFVLLLIYWLKIKEEYSYRISGSFTFSILIHVFLIGLYLGLAVLDQPEIPVLQEINFVDLTEETVEPAIKEKPVYQGKKVNSSQAEISKFTPETKNLETNSSSPLLAHNGQDQIFLDKERKQPPISMEQFRPVNNDIQYPDDLLKITPAIGIKQDDRIARPAELDLNGVGKILSAVKPSNYQNEAISLTRNLSNDQILQNTTPISANASANLNLSLKKETPKKEISDINLRDTQTLIVGPLANRQIINKTIPSFPVWAKKQGLGAEIALRFTVMENGIVKENVIVEKTSGSSEWDKLVIKALKTWRFAALEISGMRQDQTGIITFKFVI
jgi:TonB family protein